MDVLKPTTPAGRDRVARILMPAIAAIRDSGASSKDAYVVLRATVDILEAWIVDGEGQAEVDRLRALVAGVSGVAGDWR